MPAPWLRILPTARSRVSDLLGGGKNRQATYGNAAQKLAHQQDRETRRKERYKDEPDDKGQRSEQYFSVSVPLREVAIGERSDDCAHRDGIGEAVLPGRVDLIRASCGIKFAVPLGERGLGKEGTEQNNVVSLHDYRRREKQGPEYRSVVFANSLDEGHGVLLLCRLPGQVGVFGVECMFMLAKIDRTLF